MNAEDLKAAHEWAAAAFEQLGIDTGDNVTTASTAQLEQHDAPAGVQKQRKAREPYPAPHSARLDRQKRLFG